MITTMKKLLKVKVCPVCGCEYIISQVNRIPTRLCPWCDEAILVKIATEALARNKFRIEKGLIRSGKTHKR